ncbi:hypothetical protein [Streptomyces fructofermentans]|uniref:Uncharacterized protein n=1 Tax=Streptomyces fructofermentans TaxID=152141 RepID=A0A918K4H3_9ACTN|nr:hypothetical protein [Streptomyces fructofermentans]GGX47396.1 hypothetical protein GCM10010515_13080 [Streptomyces fructofermentans]
MGVYSSDLDLNVSDVTGNGREVEVGVNMVNGNVRLSILWTDEILLSPDDAERVARSLVETAARGRRIAAVPYVSTPEAPAPEAADPLPGPAES